MSNPYKEMQNSLKKQAFILLMIAMIVIIYSYMYGDIIWSI